MGLFASLHALLTYVGISVTAFIIYAILCLIVGFIVVSEAFKFMSLLF